MTHLKKRTSFNEMTLREKRNFMSAFFIYGMGVLLGLYFLCSFFEAALDLREPIFYCLMIWGLVYFITANVLCFISYNNRNSS